MYTVAIGRSYYLWPPVIVVPVCVARRQDRHCVIAATNRHQLLRTPPRCLIPYVSYDSAGTIEGRRHY